MQLTQAKRRRGDLLTAAAVAALLAVMSVLLYTGSLTRQVTNMLVPTAVYIVMAVSLNLVVGLLGELSLGHAGFMSVGLFSGCLVSIALADTALPLAVRLDKEVGKEEKVGTTVFQLRHVDGKLIDAVVEVFTEVAFCHALSQILIGSAYQSDIDIYFLVASHRTDFSFLEGTE